MNQKQPNNKSRFDEICETTQGLIDDSLLLEWGKSQ